MSATVGFSSADPRMNCGSWNPKYNMEDEVEERKSLLNNKAPENELRGCGALAACDPNRRAHRYLVLVFICSLSFGKCRNISWLWSGMMFALIIM